MQLPRQLPDKQEDKVALGEFYDIFSKMQWFERAEIIENHPTKMKKTLEVLVRYKPLLEQKEILTFTAKHNVALEMVEIRND